MIRLLALIGMGLLKALVTLVGLVAVPFMLLTKDRPKWLWRPWSNPTDGNYGPSWWPRYAQNHWFAKYFPNYWWCAIRNPANGLRTYKYLTVSVDDTYKFKGNGLPVEPSQLRELEKRFGWFYAWQGIYSGFWICAVWTKKRHMKFRIGWKIVPEQYREWRPEKAGYALAFLPWRKG
jgi:hypothetical protein